MLVSLWCFYSMRSPDSTFGQGSRRRGGAAGYLLLDFFWLLLGFGPGFSFSNPASDLSGINQYDPAGDSFNTAPSNLPDFAHNLTLD